ncbi:MAG TPA: hypothetical protein VIY86_03975, partial [Pirellulaceae bacterium]
RWRETYLVFLQEEDRPLAETTRRTLLAMGGRFEVHDMRANKAGHLNSLTLMVRGEPSAMDIVYTSGEEATEQIPELVADLKDAEDRDNLEASLASIRRATARLDVLHFQRHPAGQSEDEAEENADPTSLLLVLERLCQLCHGVAVDPQSATLVASA